MVQESPQNKAWDCIVRKLHISVLKLQLLRIESAIFNRQSAVGLFAAPFNDSHCRNRAAEKIHGFSLGIEAEASIESSLHCCW